MAHRQGPPPTYHRTLLAAGDLSNALSTWENFLLFLMQTYSVPIQHVRLCNLSDQSVDAWKLESNLPDLIMLHQPPCDFTPLRVGLLERRPELQLIGENSNYQLSMRGHVWPFRAALPEWSGGYLSSTGDQVDKGTLQSTYARWTPVFEADEVKRWLATLHDTVLELKMVGAIDPSVATAVAETKFIFVKP